MRHFKALWSILLSLLLLYIGSYILIYFTSFYYPKYPAIDLKPILSKPILSESDYKCLYEQTGLSQAIIDLLKTQNDFTKTLQYFQANYFYRKKARPVPLTLVTSMDRIQDALGNWQQAFELAPYKEGYIFITKSTHTLHWRHGHAGIVVDAVRGKVLESIAPGSLSMEQNASNWQFYPTFKMLRVKNLSDSTLRAIADFARNNLEGLPYHILSMKNQPKGYTGTYCTLVIWHAFKAFGIDLDSNDGLFVSPKDIAKSPYVETLQIYGFSPYKAW